MWRLRHGFRSCPRRSHLRVFDCQQGTVTDCGFNWNDFWLGYNAHPKSWSRLCGRGFLDSFALALLI